jgi:hypothetical protein
MKREIKEGNFMKKRYFIGVTLILWTAMLMFSLGAIAPVEALQIDLKEEIGKTTQASFEHKDRDVASKTTSVELFYQGPFYQRCDEEVYEKANLPEPSITTDETADLPTINDKFNSVLVLTLTSLEDLKADDSIPDKDWIDSLKPLTGQEFEGEESFWTAVSLEIGQPLIDQYGAQILAHARVRQADSKATSTVETTSVAQNQLHFEINLDDIIGNSYYNKTTTHPLNHDEDYARYSDPSHPDYDPDFVAKYFPGGFEEGDLFPDYSQVDNGDLAYYNNWEMTSADS